jgi:hypothetical protein
MKFCRRCGTPIDSSEATTRTFDEPVRVEAGTQPTNSWPTTPTFAPPSLAPSAQAPLTRELEQGSQKKTVIILASVVAVLLISLIVLAVILLRNTGAPATTPPPVVGQEERPGLPPPPPPPPGGAPVEINRELYYEGAKVTLETFDQRGKSVQLSTSDPVDKVADWYKSKIAATSITRGEGFVTLVGSGIAVVITREDGETQIILTHDNRRRAPGR